MDHTHVAKILYLTKRVNQKVSYALNVLSRYGNNPGPRNIKFAQNLLKYVLSTKNDRLRIQPHNSKMDIETIMSELLPCDADLVGNPDTLHSQTSYIGYLGTSLMSWCSTDQGSIATSTSESEIKAVDQTLKSEAISNRGILNPMGWKQTPTVIEKTTRLAWTPRQLHR